MEYLFSTSLLKPAQEAQKFHRLLVEGFAMYEKSCRVITLSSIPVNSTIHKRRIWSIKPEIFGNIKYTYILIINLPIIRNIVSFVIVFIKTVLSNLLALKETQIVICDLLNCSIASAALLACKLTATKAVVIVTDLPYIMGVSLNSKFNFKTSVFNKVVSFFMVKFDGYVLLTEQMNIVVNPNAKPSLIMEGLVDINMKISNNSINNKAAQRILIYAGGIYEKYGVKKLIEAFRKLGDDDIRLHIYGSGEMENDMTNYMKLDDRLIYQGVVLNEIVVQRELEAILLINPRSSKEEYTKYSFPSKNMEYMASGTPLVTTPLPGMPEEYYKYVYLFNDESVEGMYHTLKQLLSKPKEELHQFGNQAKQFVLNNKSNWIQAKRLLSFFEEVNSFSGKPNPIT